MSIIDSGAFSEYAYEEFRNAGFYVYHIGCNLIVFTGNRLRYVKLHSTQVSELEASLHGSEFAYIRGLLVKAREEMESLKEKLDKDLRHFYKLAIGLEDLVSDMDFILLINSEEHIPKLSVWSLYNFDSSLRSLADSSMKVSEYMSGIVTTMLKFSQDTILSNRSFVEEVKLIRGNSSDCAQVAKTMGCDIELASCVKLLLFGGSFIESHVASEGGRLARYYPDTCMAIIDAWNGLVDRTDDGTGKILFRYIVSKNKYILSGKCEEEAVELSNKSLSMSLPKYDTISSFFPGFQ